MEPISIPLKNRHGEIVAHSLISPEDFENVSKFKWHMYHNSISKKSYVVAKIDKKNVLLHHFIIGRPKDNMIIDHINGDGLDNRRENLRHASKKQNSQNMNRNVSSKTSSYIGVAKIKNSTKFEVACGNYKLGRYEDEKEAAKLYDICAYLVYGEGAKTNHLITYQEATSQYKLEDIIVKPRERQHKDLPAGLYARETAGGVKYFAQLHSRKHAVKLKSSYFENKDDALLELNKFRNHIQQLEAKALDEHYKKDISTNNEGLAVIQLGNDKTIIVDANLWHELSLQTWWISHGYIRGMIDGTETMMHTYLYKKYIGDIPNDHVIDHINKVKHDNRLCNLRVNTLSGNAHNVRKTKNASSKYYGVYWDKKGERWFACITKNYMQYNIGVFKDEIDAAKAYNVKAKELFGEFANLNVIPDERAKD